MTKNMLRGQDIEVQKRYVRAVLNDPAINVSHYAFPPEIQLDLMRHFIICEFSRVAEKRENLIANLNSPDLKQAVLDFIDYSKKYEFPWGYTESLIKSYGYRMIIESLQNESNILKNRSLDEYRVISLVDGGYPFVFWWSDFLSAQERNSQSRFSKSKTPIFGITHGDEYYPVISLAGNVATITNRVHGMIYPQSVKLIARPLDFSLQDYCEEYERRCLKPRFFPRILFIGEIDVNLQYLIPFIQFRKTGHKIFEPFRVSYGKGGTISSFYKKFRGNSKRDLVVCGKIRKNIPAEVCMREECKMFGLNMVSAQDFFGDFEDLLQEIDEEAKGSNLDRSLLQKIELRLKKTKEIVKRGL